ncbi:Predicted arabinose efflux permease, MFS family [Xaviernesmea oryzae]|uniref:Predicted arabinose efflux permease, MFS family n=1 Tax=Xaviernesmea oryzae TaxID=464029 RepID=A0A1X7E0F1_9HYPH|nr:MFS transporter [Xaviernesmea oryzae]SMF24914.1 Predicted arabinose efflux permease, MFS family [Xaviernesmea oryzae]
MKEPVLIARGTSFRNCGLIWLLAATAGLVVANNYYNQPLLPDMAREFSISESAVSWISSFTQLGYALGMLLILPLGDRMDRRNLIALMLLLSFGALLLFAMADYPVIVGAGFLVGFVSIVPQMLPPIASQLAKGRDVTGAVGKVMGGLLLGIALSRFLGGWAGELFGWRSVYLAAGAVMLALMVLLRWVLPPMPPTFSGSYPDLMWSLWKIWRAHALLRWLATAAALQFGAFSLFWTTLGFHLRALGQNYSASMTGNFALIGATGVAGAMAIGHISHRLSARTILTLGGVLMVIAFIGFALASASVLWLAPAVIVLDLGMQISHVTSMASVLALDADARSRVNTVYMTIRFLGAALGTYAGSLAWVTGGWLLVCTLGAVLCASALAIQKARSS